MAVIESGSSNDLAEVDANGNLAIVEGLPEVPAAGGFYTVGGGISSVVAASLAANTMLMSARLAAASLRKAYVTEFRLLVAAATVGASALVPGALGLQRFTAQTPTGGAAQTPNRLNEALGTVSDITDIRSSNAALTGSAPTFGTIVGMVPVPIFVANGPMYMEWIFKPDHPIVLAPGDGLALRSQIAMPATQTWTYGYNMNWFEK